MLTVNINLFTDHCLVIPHPSVRIPSFGGTFVEKCLLHVSSGAIFLLLLLLFSFIFLMTCYDILGSDLCDDHSFALASAVPYIFNIFSLIIALSFWVSQCVCAALSLFYYICFFLFFSNMLCMPQF